MKLIWRMAFLLLTFLIASLVGARGFGHVSEQVFRRIVLGFVMIIRLTTLLA